MTVKQARLLVSDHFGPDHMHYWHVWTEVLDNAKTLDGGVFYQNGDLWLIYPEQAIEAVNDLCESMVDYETTHADAGENYAHLVGESWDIQKTRDMVKKLNCCLVIDPRWEDIDPDVLADMALESFVMESGHAYGVPSGIVLDGFPVGEVEVDLSGLDIDGVTMEYISESCEAYLSGDGYAYVSTGVAWYAVLDVQMFNAHIEQYVNDKES